MAEPQQVEREIEETRDELADTVAALAERTDVKGQVKAKVDETKAAASERVEEAKSRPVVPLAIAGAVVAVAVIVWAVRR
jgi:1-acyl-sn-glycerol-3-phosphate acyltransferase